MKHYLAAVLLCVTQGLAAQPYGSIVGDALKLGTPNDHWFSARGKQIAYLIDGDKGSVEATLTLSMFSPAIEPHLDAGRIYSYGSFYTRTFYGDRTDVVLVFDLENALPIKEIEIPPKSAGIGHGGMIGLVEERFIGVWNITPAMSVSIVDTADDRFVGEISTPGCAGVYPVDAGFLMACGDGRIQYIRLDSVGEEVDRIRSEPFFSVTEDPVFDYAVPTPEGWMFLSLEGQVYEVTVANSEVQVSQPWSINPQDAEDAVDLNGVPIDADDDWRIGGRQPFAYNAEAGLLVTLMHQGGGQETFEDPGTQVWAFSTKTRRRAYVLELDEETKGSSVELTADGEPLLLIAPANGGELLIHDALNSRLLRTVPEINASTLQRLE
ncbi:amine dehydrogenase large subunit [Congregibacter litoralis]|uniref:Methylamine dehydrogenase heavy chain (MADH) n=1 Tax=Congregibacter litoralis KT71 TaxID=314285 RepID=A4A7G1_9GAMM|nr:amine dehydrogenase large subunit [Congregibacter litoralis]EAQ98230.1 Methylamine dehydrogenase heavy chain (MADH) [Congregibacter litoralis KT71]